MAKLKSKKVAPKPKAAPAVEEAPKENRGRKPKEICIEDVRNEAKELIVHLRTLIASREAAGKNSMRFRKAAQVLEHQLRTHYIE